METKRKPDMQGQATGREKRVCTKNLFRYYIKPAGNVKPDDISEKPLADRKEQQ